MLLHPKRIHTQFRTSCRTLPIHRKQLPPGRNCFALVDFRENGSSQTHAAMKLCPSDCSCNDKTWSFRSRPVVVEWQSMKKGFLSPSLNENCRGAHLSVHCVVRRRKLLSVEEFVQSGPLVLRRSHPIVAASCWQLCVAVWSGLATLVFDARNYGT